MTASAYVNRDDSVRNDLDTLEAVPTILIAARLLKAGMVLVDPDLDTPAVEIDHKMRTVRNSGQVSFLVFDYDRKSHTEESFHANKMIKVMARA